MYNKDNQKKLDEKVNSFYFEQIKYFQNNLEQKLYDYKIENIKKEYNSINDVISDLKIKIKSLPNYDYIKESLDDIIKNNRKVLVYWDYDVDWLSSMFIFNYMLKILWVPIENISIFLPNREKDWYWFKEESLLKEYIQDFIFNNKSNWYIISLDNGTNNDKLFNKLKDFWIKYMVIDHHLPKWDINNYVLNPHLDKSIFHIEKNICTWMLTYWLWLAYIEDSELRKKFWSSDALDFAVISTIWDYMKLDWINRWIVKNFSKKVISSNNNLIKLLVENNKNFLYENQIEEFISFNIISILNAIWRMTDMSFAYMFISWDSNVTLNTSKIKDFFKEINIDYNFQWIEDIQKIKEELVNLNDYVKKNILVKINENKKSLVAIYKEKIDENLHFYRDKNILLYEENKIQHWILSILSTGLWMKYWTLTWMWKIEFDKIRYSLRCPVDNISLEKEFQLLWYKYAWHDSAWVCEINFLDKEKFKEDLSNHFNKIEFIKKNNVIMDIDSQYWINNQLLDLLYSFWPFWAWFNEPLFRFIWEFVPDFNWNYIDKSKSWKVQKLHFKVWDKVYTTYNYTWYNYDKEFFKSKKEFIWKMWYPFSAQKNTDNHLKIFSF